jgi:hypothetical protein
MKYSPIVNSTNVRFLLLASLGTLYGCATTTPLSVQRSACGAGTKAVCATLGPERSCACAPRLELDRFLKSFGEPAWLGATP